MNFAARLGCTAVGLRPPSVAPQTRIRLTTETRQRDPLIQRRRLFRQAEPPLWDTQGLCLFAKRLESGRFTWPRSSEGVAYLTAAQLGLLLEGIDWRAPRRPPRPALAG